MNIILAQEIIGIDDPALTSGAVTVLILVVYWLARLLWSSLSQDSKQIDLQAKLVDMNSEALDNNKKLVASTERSNELLEKNTRVIEKIEDTLGKFNTELANSLAYLVRSILSKQENNVEILSIKLNEVQKDLIRNSDTTVVIRDAEGNDVVRLTAKPERCEGEEILVISFEEI